MDFVGNPVLLLRRDISLHLALHVKSAENDAAEPHIKFSLPARQLGHDRPFRLEIVGICDFHHQNAAAPAALKRKHLIGLSADPKRRRTDFLRDNARHQLFPLLLRHAADDDLLYGLFLAPAEQHGAVRRDTPRDQSRKLAEHPLGIVHRHKGKSLVHVGDARQCALGAPVFLDQAEI